jgi:release factor glutamine methyltransferase
VTVVGDGTTPLNAAMENTFSALLDELEQDWTPLPDKPEETPELALRALWHAAHGKPVSVDRAGQDRLPPLDDGALGRLRALLDRRKAGTPLAHLTQRQTFLGLEYLAGPDALIPRRETEILGRAAMAKLNRLARERGPLRVLDVCTGSGNLALAYAWYVPTAQVYASDICHQALDLARRNRSHFGLDARVQLLQGDLMEPFASPHFLGQCDFVSANPPYISAAKVEEMHPEISRHEPAAAFNGGAYGVSILKRLLVGAARFLKPDSWFGVEVGRGQGAGVVRQLRNNPAFAEVETFRDGSGEVRAVFARTA